MVFDCKYDKIYLNPEEPNNQSYVNRWRFRTFAQTEIHPVLEIKFLVNDKRTD